jgi:hypothetical protein
MLVSFEYHNLRDLPVHLILNHFSKLLGELGALLIHTEQTVDLGFDLFSEIQMIFRVFSEPLLVLFRKSVLSLSGLDVCVFGKVRFQSTRTKRWRDSCGRAHVNLYLLAYLLELGHNLYRRASRPYDAYRLASEVNTMIPRR